MSSLSQGLRLALLAWLVILVQQALLLAHPAWRCGLDLYMVWLLAVGSSYGLGPAILLAVVGGLCVDATSYCFDWFHTCYYLLPALVGSLFAGQMLREYNLLAAFICAGLGLLKVLLMLLVGMLSGWLPSPLLVFRLSYFPLFILCVVVFIAWKPLLAFLSARRGLRFGN